jgi:hypothetical protein
MVNYFTVFKLKVKEHNTQFLCFFLNSATPEAPHCNFLISKTFQFYSTRVRVLLPNGRAASNSYF